MNGKHSQGEIISDRYQVVTTLGQGGMGTTYAAVDLQNHQRVAIKAVSLRRTQEWKVLDLFEREAKVLGTLRHPNIPNYIDYFHWDTDHDRTFYLVQELVEGESLATVVKRGVKLNEEQVKEIVIQLLKILNYLHSLYPPVIHRDIKPQNIILCPDGRVYLVDFGAVQEIYRNTVKFAGTFVGTVGYIAPEQFSGQCVPASDLYSLGCTILFLLTHRSPNDLPQKKMRFDLRDRIFLSPAFTTWLEKMVEPNREDRFLSADQALRVLQQKSSSVSKQDSYPTYKFRQFTKPAYTNITLEKKRDLLVIDIPFRSIPFEDFFTCLFVISSFVFLLFTMFNTLLEVDFFADAGWIISLMFLFGFVCFIVVLDSFWFDLFSQRKMIINQEKFNLNIKTFYGQKIKTGYTNNIKQIRFVRQNVLVNRFSCIIDHSFYKLVLSERLTRRESLWLVQELSAFIEEINNNETNN